MQDQVSTLEVQLREKEELVAVLTQRLEQAAEQLDRIHRTGGDRGLRLGGGFPPELVESHKNLVGELQQAVEQWEQMQAAATLGRLEVQISELHDLIADQGGKAITGEETPQPLQDARPEDDINAGVGKGDRSNLPERPDGCFAQMRPVPFSDASADDEPDAWETLKAGLLAKDSEPAQEAPEAEEIVESHQPEPIDFLTADTKELQCAIESRDEYISFLIKKLRIVQSRQSVALPDWAALENVPEELRQGLQELEGRLEETLRISEVELSIERARLSREEVRLQQIEYQVEKKMNLLGLSLEDGAPVDGFQATDDSHKGKGRRWLRFLGVGNGEEYED